ncbi:hypothetical protein X777_08529 [Ooceraea biroi]|uniref:Uncharacterized protein n=1 Tax=Ooceraea biroi TaxID=2015173 RepID=A0A026WBM9_OOCBI|nr:hypothetical protein X777_08529 [Ooceraea biroi]
MGTQIAREEYRVRNGCSMQILPAARATRRPALPGAVIPSKRFTATAWTTERSTELIRSSSFP